MIEHDIDTLPDYGFPYPVALHSWGGQSRCHDYRMSDGSITTLHENEISLFRERVRVAITAGKRDGLG